MHNPKDIILVVDYHAKNIEIRRLNCATGEERRLRIPTAKSGILRLVDQAVAEATLTGGQVVWIMESTTGWARVKQFIGHKVRFAVANVLRMPLPPKAYRRKSDKIDTGRLLREYLNGSLPQSYQPTMWWREIRRIVDSRQDIVERQTAVKNWISHFLHHETWKNRTGLWTQKGMRYLRRIKLSDSDRMLMNIKLTELEQLAGLRKQLEAAMQATYDQWQQAQWVWSFRGCVWEDMPGAQARVRQ